MKPANHDTQLANWGRAEIDCQSVRPTSNCRQRSSHVSTGRRHLNCTSDRVRRKIEEEATMRHRKLKSLLAFLILLILGLQQTIRAQDYSFTTIAGVGPSSVDGTNNASRFRFPQSILADDSGNLTVLDIGNASIRRLNRQGTNWISSTILGAANGYGEPPNTPYAGFSHSQGLAFGQGGSFYIGDLQRLRKAEFHRTNWTVRTLAGWIPDNGDAEQPPGGILFSQITDLARHPDGTLLIADGSEIRAFSEQGTNVTIHTIARNASLASFRGVAVNALGAVFATIGSECTVACISHEGTNWVQRTIAGLAGVSGTTDGAGSEARFDQPEGIAVDSAGNLYVADRSGQTVRKVLHSGTNWVVTTISGSSEKAGFADGIAIAANLFGPSKVSTDGAGHVFVADSINDAIRELVPVDTNWIVRTIAGNEPAAIGATSTADRFVFPEGIAVDEAGMVYVADTDTWTIKQIHRDGETRRTRIVAGVPGVLVTNNAQGIDAHLGPFKTVTLGPNHRLYTVDGFGKIRQLVQEETNWTVTTIVDFPRAVRNPSETNFPDSFFVPGGLAADQLGNLYASLPTRGSIYRISPDAGQWKITKIAYLGEYQTPVTGVVPYGYPLGIGVH